MKKIGCDISHYQKVDWKKFDPDFVVCKCTQGTGFLDPTYAENKKQARKKGILFGSYHFTDGKDFKKEADWYLKNVDLKEGEILALDYEIHLKDPVTYCKNFLDYVEKKTGVKPFIYLNLATAKGFDWSKVKNPLWLARYRKKPDGTIDEKRHDPNYPFVIHQYTSNGKIDGIATRVDLNYTEGSIEKYALQAPQKPKEVEKPIMTLEVPPSPVLEVLEPLEIEKPTLLDIIIKYLESIWKK